MTVVYVLSGLAVLVLIISYVTYRMAFYASDRQKAAPNPLPDGEQYRPVKEMMKSLEEELKALPYEEVTVKAYDGTVLAGRYYHVRDGAPLQIQCHGYRGQGVRDFCGGNKMSRDSGHNALIIDQRAHGKSGGHTIAFGIKERYDCLSWINYASERFGNPPIFLTGVSMGAATVLMAAGLDLPKNVVGIMADCPYSSPEKIIKKVCGEMHIPPAVGFPFVRLGGLIFGRLNICETTAAKEVSKAKVPILIIHGEEDRFVPCDMSEEIALSCASPITRLTFPGAAHGISYMTDPQRYEKAVSEFMEACLSDISSHRQ